MTKKVVPSPSASWSENEERFRILAEISPVGICQIDVNGKALFTNKSWETITGISPLKMKNKKWLTKFIAADSKDIFQEWIKKGEQHKKSTNEYQIKLSSNNYRWVKGTTVGLFTTTNTLKGFLITLTDITDDKQTESYRQFFSEASKILSFSLDYQTTLNNIAQIAIPTFGDWCSVDMLQSDGSIKLVAIAHKDPKKVNWAKKIREQNPSHINDDQGTAVAIKTGKSQFYPSINYDALTVKKLGLKGVMIIPLFSAHKPIGAMSFITDDSQREYTREDLSMAEELAERASLAIDNARLFLSEEKAVVAREEFISIASHELKTPITSIKAFNQILKQKLTGKVDNDTMKMIDRTEGQIERLIKLVRDLLDITKIQAGKLIFNEEVFDIFTLVTEIVNDFQLIKKSHEITLEGKAVYNVLGDKDRLGQVVNNLISNAIKYSPKQKKIIITVSSDKKVVTVQVQDFGIGIDKAYLPRVFERFFRGNQSESGSLSSLGLGLYISAEIVHRHHGEIWVKSKKGKGSTFFFQLPLAK